MPNEAHHSQSGSAPHADARADGVAGGACRPANRGDKITAGSDGRAHGTTAAARFGAEGVRDLRLLVQMAVLAPWRIRGYRLRRQVASVVAPQPEPIW